MGVAVEIRNDEVGRLAEFDSPASARDLATLASEGVDRVSVLQGATRAKGSTLDWLDGCELRQLVVWTPGRTIPGPPERTLQGLESLIPWARRGSPSRPDFSRTSSSRRSRSGTSSAPCQR